MRKARTKKKARRAWTKDEVKLLKGLFPQGRAREIAKRIGRSLTAVRQKAYDMGIKTRESRLWSDSEIRQLKRLYPSENPQSIAGKLGRSYWKLILGKADVDAALSFLFEKYSRNGVSRNSTTSVETQAVAAKRS